MRFESISLDGIRTISLEERKHKVHVGEFARPPRPGASFGDFVRSLPDILAGKEFREFVGRVADAVKGGRTVAVGMGGHVVKTGMGPVLAGLMERGAISALAMNGAAAIHDVEVAMAGATSEDVARGLEDGSFGMAMETAEFLNSTARQAGEGFGRALGDRMERERLPFREHSLLWNAHRFGVTATVHVALGTDVVHQHPSCDGAAVGRATYLDFRIFCSVVASLEGGVYINLGSAVVLPEVFLKALTVVRNLGHPVRHFTTANFDMLQHYRPSANVVERPTRTGGKGYAFTGHHELMIPLFACALLEHLEGKDAA
ncbi:MAG TPA: hypothetical protein EYP17_08865 [Candidatus Latescibacteria bacterium]|nr:hypothetical protein [Candidatus Latescibacterota bacterium]